jgi:hypothetical protein
MCKTSCITCRLQRQHQALLNYLNELKDEAQAEIRHKGSPVTSLREDVEINHMGSEKLKIIRRILKTLEVE